MLQLLLALLILAGVSAGQVVVQGHGADTTATFGAVFAPGEMLSIPTPTSDDAEILAYQTNIISSWGDGSIKTAFIGVVLKAASQPIKVRLEARDETPQKWGPPVIPNDDPSFFFSGPSGESTRISARQMMIDGHFRVIYDGPVVTMVEVADHVGRSTDWNGIHPFFHVWIYHQTGATFVRWIAENGNSEDFRDRGPYTVSLGLGNAGSREVYRSSVETHWVMSRWARSAWIGDPVTAAVKPDVESLVSTGILPRYFRQPADAELAAVKTLPADLPIGAVGPWRASGPSGGGHAQIGPHPEFDLLAVLSGDPRVMTAAMRAAELVGWFPIHIREGRQNSVWSGGPISTAIRPTLHLGNPTYSYTRPEHRVMITGPIAALYTPGRWSQDRAHLHNGAALLAAVTGDPYLIEEALFIAAWAQAVSNGAAVTNSNGRGPTGAEGFIPGEPRGKGHALHQRLCAWFVQPDGHWKEELNLLILDCLAADAGQRKERLIGISAVLTERASFGWGDQVWPDYPNAKRFDRGLPLNNELTEGSTAYSTPTNSINRLAAKDSWAPWQYHFIIHAYWVAHRLGFPSEHLLSFSGHGVMTHLAHPALREVGIDTYARPISGLDASWLTAEGISAGWIHPPRGRGSYTQFATPAVAAAEYAHRRGMDKLSTCPMRAEFSVDFGPWAAWTDRIQSHHEMRWSTQP